MLYFDLLVFLFFSFGEIGLGLGRKGAPEDYDFWSSGVWKGDAMWAHRSQGALKKFPELQIGKHFWWKEYCCKFSQFDTVSAILSSATSLKTFWNPSALMMTALFYTSFLEKCEFVCADSFCAWRWSAQYGLTHISAGDLLRAEVAAGTDSGNKAQEYMQKGMLVPDEIVVTVCVFTVFVLLLGSSCHVRYSLHFHTYHTPAPVSLTNWTIFVILWRNRQKSGSTSGIYSKKMSEIFLM